MVTNQYFLVQLGPDVGGAMEPNLYALCREVKMRCSDSVSTFNPHEYEKFQSLIVKFGELDCVSVPMLDLTSRLLAVYIYIYCLDLAVSIATDKYGPGRIRLLW